MASELDATPAGVGGTLPNRLAPASRCPEERRPGRLAEAWGGPREDQGRPRGGPGRSGEARGRAGKGQGGIVRRVGLGEGTKTRLAAPRALERPTAAPSLGPCSGPSGP